jgi:sigma-E factor negative regulatory protein RseA
MNQELRQQLSALVDGELDRDQARFLIRRLQDDVELAGCWQRWHVTGECLKGAAPAPMRIDFVARIAAEIQSDPVPGRRLPPGTLRWAGGFAVAASVALAALLAIPREAGQGPDQNTLVTVAPAPAGPAQVAPSPYREQDLRPALQVQTVSAMESSPYAAAVRIDPRIESYLVRHNEATAGQGQGFLPYVTLVTPLRERVPAAASR